MFSDHISYFKIHKWPCVKPTQDMTMKKLDARS
jgi:hypothetical protein